jgi:serine/threonine-protein kinase RsbW
MHDGSITIRLAVDPQDIERLNRLVRQFGELHEVPGRTLYALNLALDEVVTNVVCYGFEDAANQEVVVRIAIADRELTASVSDGGRPFDPLSVPPPNLTVGLEERTPGGLGIHLVRSLMDRVEYTRQDGKNVLTVKKRIR